MATDCGLVYVPPAGVNAGGPTRFRFRASTFESGRLGM